MVAQKHADKWQIVLFQNTPNGPAIGSGGAYFDRLAKTDGKWFFAHRRIDRFVAEGK